MAISYPSLSSQILVSLQGQGLSGTSLPSYASAISNAFVQWIPSLVVITNHTGVLGSGQGTGKALLNPLGGISATLQTTASVGFTGTSLPNMITGIIQGISNEVNAMSQVSTTIVGTSTGTGTGTITGAIPSALSSLLNASFISFGFSGTAISNLSQGLALGICTWIPTAVITTVDVGTPVSPYSISSGIGTGILT